MASIVPCFWVWRTQQAELGLRRYVSSNNLEEPCPHDRGYHSAVTNVGRGPLNVDQDTHTYSAIEAVTYAGDPRWPTECDACGHVFADDDMWQVMQEPIVVGYDGVEYLERALPPGAMFDAPWNRYRGAGPDGISLTVVLPPATASDTRGNWWLTDGPAYTNGQQTPDAWKRTGDPTAQPPTVDVKPSILTDQWHGHLHGPASGYEESTLVEC